MRGESPAPHREASTTSEGVVMNLPTEGAQAPSDPHPPGEPAPRIAQSRRAPALALWQLNLMRIGYLVMGVGLAVTKWPLLVGDRSWELMEGTVTCILVAMSILALLGLRYPSRMLPILLFEVAWKLTWLAVVALPLWLDGNLESDARAQATEVAWVVIIVAVIPWRHVVAQYVRASAEPFVRHEHAT
jgi:hypothetical protein